MNRFALNEGLQTNSTLDLAWLVWGNRCHSLQGLIFPIPQPASLAALFQTLYPSSRLLLGVLSPGV